MMYGRSLLAAGLLAVPAFLPAQPAGPRVGAWGFEIGDMDRRVKPGDDFFAYAEGTWLKNHEIAADRVSAGWSYDLPDEVEGQVRTIVEAAASHPTTPNERRIGDFYAAWMDEGGIEARGLTTIRPYLARIEAAATPAELFRLMSRPGWPTPVYVGVSIDQDDPNRWAVGAWQAQLGLPAREYYLSPNEKFASIRNAYRDYLVRLQTLAGIPDAAAKADRIVSLETRLSEGQWSAERIRDPVATHNPMTRAQLAALAPGLDWPRTLESAGLGEAAMIDVAEPSAIADAGRLLADVPLATWKAWVAARFVGMHAAMLPNAIDRTKSDFYDGTLMGVPERRPRWRRGVELVDRALGDAVGAAYVQRHWTAATSAKVDELVGDVLAAYREAILGATWMDGSTRDAAFAKLARLEPRVGRPASWIDYSTLPVDRGDPLANDLASRAFAQHLRALRLPHPVDRGLWSMTPQTVDAYYDASTNQITLPAAMLQPPFFDPAADPAVNYGAAGATTIGHEIGHAFDDAGRLYDGTGRLRDWWTARSSSAWKSRADRLAEQFGRYEPLPGLHVDGRLTLGENLADLAGLETAYAAWRRYVARHGEPPVLDGFTGDQRFFLAYAQAWQGKWREGAQRAALLADQHSPERFRVDGIVRNFGPWYSAFGVRPGDALYLPPDERVSIWSRSPGASAPARR